MEHSRQRNAASVESSNELNIRKLSAASPEVLLDSSDSEIDVSVASGSGYHPKCSTAPAKRKKKSESSRQQAEAVAGGPDNESSSDSPQSPPKPSETPERPKSKFDLKAILDYHFRRKNAKADAWRRHMRGAERKSKKSKYVSTQMPVGRPALTASPQERRRRLLDRGVQFPFFKKHYGKTHIPLRMVLGYEQAAIKGYLRYVEMVKYEDCLKKALKALQASEDLERQCVMERRHKYLDDEGPISPIQETNDNDDSLNSDNQEDHDVTVVENSAFILSSKIPSKKKSQKRNVQN
ncbi:TATA box-binding protein-associated factor RNA polymerase I subunit D [Neopsephotus bourkii]|uniref:TATA box-binding protein-associated factor RNA polymerase I subunit D n=1 Tax=Neopsephotus bourkii TaxID=309878 RepID=UPI002AA59B82|nr:TATA box-binding protein-associated factor RNA polymerase I subunit D [Neopsephotus bourkii]XP_061199618.1 TATA box-binding protein-associated factor RNA polymerase I subunit D [Neopsephotus bourkii]